MWEFQQKRSYVKMTSYTDLAHCHVVDQITTFCHCSVLVRQSLTLTEEESQDRYASPICSSTFMAWVELTSVVMDGIQN